MIRGQKNSAFGMSRGTTRDVPTKATELRNRQVMVRFTAAERAKLNAAAETDRDDAATWLWKLAVRVLNDEALLLPCSRDQKKALQKAAGDQPVEIWLQTLINELVRRQLGDG